MPLGRHFSAITGFDRNSGVYRRARRMYRFLNPRPVSRTYFSQFGEDAVLASLVGDTIGTYVDVGAGAPVMGSNTYLLYSKGWHGVCIDPVAANIKKAQDLRPRDRQVWALCGEQEGLQTFFEYDPYEFSTISKDRVTELALDGLSPVRTYELPSLTLGSLDLRAQPHDPSILCIDVEGWELPVLRGTDWTRYRPALICIEEWRSPLEGDMTISSFLAPQGYALKARVGFSSFYLHEHAQLDWH